MNDVCSLQTLTSSHDLTNEALNTNTLCSENETSSLLVDSYNSRLASNQLSMNTNDDASNHETTILIRNYASDEDDHRQDEDVNYYMTCKICLNKFVDNSHVPQCINEVDSSKCKNDVAFGLIYQIQSCKCKFCVNCLKQYIKQCIENCDVFPINCPDFKCNFKGSLSKQEVKNLILNANKSIKANDYPTSDANNNKINFIDMEYSNQNEVLISENYPELNLYKQYLNIYENNEILRDPYRVHCSRPNCENVCTIKDEKTVDTDESKIVLFSNTKVTCDKCNYEFCSICFKKWTNNTKKLNETNLSKLNKKLSKMTLINLDEYCDCDGLNESLTNERIGKTKKIKMISEDNENTKSTSNSNAKSVALNDFENIKRCPKCSILIERADGCAQIMCRGCRHTFCWYCNCSLDDDFLLKHFTQNGPCKGKLGHSRFSLFIHRISVVSIFFGTVILIIILSPLLLLTLPCFIFSAKCRKKCFTFSAKFS